MENIKATLAWVYASSMAVLTAIAEQAGAIEPDRLVWMLGFAGGLIGAALLPSEQVWKTVAKAFSGWVIAGVLATPLVTSHLAPPFVNVHVAALWLGFAGPALFVASARGNAFISRLINREKSA